MRISDPYCILLSVGDVAVASLGSGFGFGLCFRRDTDFLQCPVCRFGLRHVEERIHRCFGLARPILLFFSQPKKRKKKEARISGLKFRRYRPKIIMKNDGFLVFVTGAILGVFVGYLAAPVKYIKQPPFYIEFNPQSRPMEDYGNIAIGAT